MGTAVAVFALVVVFATVAYLIKMTLSPNDPSPTVGGAVAMRQPFIPSVHDDVVLEPDLSPPYPPMTAPLEPTPQLTSPPSGAPGTSPISPTPLPPPAPLTRIPPRPPPLPKTVKREDPRRSERGKRMPPVEVKPPKRGGRSK